MISCSWMPSISLSSSCFSGSASNSNFETTANRRPTDQGACKYPSSSFTFSKGSCIHVKLKKRASQHLPARAEQVAFVQSPSATSRAAPGSGGGRGLDLEVDAVIVGAGIIGLTIAHELLYTTKLKVAVVDAAQPCAGATGAGQGYIWMGHRQPGSAGWALALESKLRWEDFNEQMSLDPAVFSAIGSNPLGWLNTGSLLVATTPQESESMRKHVEAISNLGIEMTVLDSKAAVAEEPALALAEGGAAALSPHDSQIDAERAMHAILQRCRAHKESGRYIELFNEGVDSLLRFGWNVEVQGVQTTKRKVHSREGVVIATGAWSSGLMATIAADKDQMLAIVPPVKPRKGHLLVLEGPSLPPLRRALMEFEYTSHYKAPAEVSSPAPHQQPNPAPGHVMAVADVAVTMTVAIDDIGRMLIGSSREFCGFDKSVSDETIRAMIHRAAEFVPSLAHPSLMASIDQRKVRTGLRPFSQDGRPLIGPVSAMPGLFMATGHEGSGLCLSWGTAALVKSAILGCKPPVNPTPFLPDGRLSPPPSSAG